MIHTPQRRPAIWLWPNLVGLDAPLVALTWQAFLAFCFAVPLRPVGRAVLGLTVWAIYIADRLLDVRDAGQEREPERHRFHRRHRGVFRVLLALILCADLAAVLLWLRPAVFRSGLYPFTAVLLYLGVIHRQRLRVAKEAAVALLFTVGTFLIGWTFSEHRLSLLLPALAFLLLCLGNLVAIEIWEWRELRHGAGDRPHSITILLERKFLWWMGALAAAALSGGTVWYAAIALSAGAIATLYAVGTRWSLNARRVLVDAAMLTPLLWLLR